MITEVTYFRTSDGDVHPTRGLAEAHEESIATKKSKAAEIDEAMRKRWPGLQTAGASYDDGFDSGLNWPAKWAHAPGGPFVHSPGHSSDPLWLAYCEATRKNNLAYLRGWRDGMLKQYEGRTLPRFFSPSHRHA